MENNFSVLCPEIMGNQPSVWPVYRILPPLPPAPLRKNWRMGIFSHSLIVHGNNFAKIEKNRFHWPQFLWLMFHVTSVLKMSHATNLHQVIIDRVRHFYNRFTLYQAQALVKDKDPDLL